MTDEKRRTSSQLLLRFPEASDLRQRLEEISQRNNRSLTKEIIFRLEQSLASEEAEADHRSKQAVQKLNKILMSDLMDPAPAQPISLEDRISRVEAALKKLGIEP